jgi:hypothetical protein
MADAKQIPKVIKVVIGDGRKDFSWIVGKGKEAVSHTVSVGDPPLEVQTATVLSHLKSGSLKLYTTKKESTILDDIRASVVEE